ncbi:hypothetical protein P7C70_g7352, partial [Phenoliferia sp. Uapishka_3]
MTPTLTTTGKAALAQILDEAAVHLPGLGMVVTSVDGVLFKHYAGKVDVLDPQSPTFDEHTIQFFASTTKLLTSVAILQLIDNLEYGLTLDSPASLHLPQLATPLRIFQGLDEHGAAIYGSTNTEITLQMMLNQTSGFGAEFASEVVAWKSTLKAGEKGAGFVNSCKIDNLIHTPIVSEPGTVYQYGNSADLESYMQEHVFMPLGMTSTSYLPFEGELAKRLMPLRWWNEDLKRYEVLSDQFPGLTLPRVISEIEYPVGGGGIFSNPSDYSLLLRHLLISYKANTASSVLKLSATTIESLFKPTLPLEARKGLNAMIGTVYEAEEVGDLDWTTGMCFFGKEKRGGWGR